MLVNRFHHPRLHYTSWVWTMYIYVLPCFLVLETDTGTGSSPFVVLGVTEVTQQRQGLFKGEVLRSFLNRSINFSFEPIASSFHTKILNIVPKQSISHKKSDTPKDTAILS